MNKRLALMPFMLLIVLGLFMAFTTPAQADVSTASPTATTGYVTRQETVCDTGSYGQQNCHVVFTQVPVHTTVNAGIDPRVLAVLTGTAAASAMVILATLRVKI